MRARFLVFAESVFQAAAENCFQPEHRGFAEAAAVVADVFFPGLAAVAANETNRDVRQNLEKKCLE